MNPELKARFIAAAARQREEFLQRIAVDLDYALMSLADEGDIDTFRVTGFHFGYSVGIDQEDACHAIEERIARIYEEDDKVPEDPYLAGSMQDAEQAQATNKCWLAWRGDPVKLVAGLNKFGLVARHNGDPGTRIYVTVKGKTDETTRDIS